MFNWLKPKMPEPAGPAQKIKTFNTSDKLITENGIKGEQGGWRIDSQEKQSVRLFEVSVSQIEQCMLTYRAQMKSDKVKDKAYLEMWCRLPGRGEFFSKGLRQPLKGTTNWATFEVVFYLKKREAPDLIKLNVAFEGSGSVWIKDIELFKTPLK
ncbi:MAG: hypothetical protein PHE49_03495 [bacterium]|nr:hypothetical protein [bacterium]